MFGKMFMVPAVYMVKSFIIIDMIFHISPMVTFIRFFNTRIMLVHGNWLTNIPTNMMTKIR